MKSTKLFHQRQCKKLRCPTQKTKEVCEMWSCVLCIISPMVSKKVRELMQCKAANHFQWQGILSKLEVDNRISAFSLPYDNIFSRTAYPVIVYPLIVCPLKVYSLKYIDWWCIHCYHFLWKYMHRCLDIVYALIVYHLIAYLFAWE